MSDQLGEAIVHVARTGRAGPSMDEVLAAARNWHALTNGDDVMRMRMTDALAEWAGTDAPEDIGIWLEAASVALAALAVTADEEGKSSG